MNCDTYYFPSHYLQKLPQFLSSDYWYMFPEFILLVIILALFPICCIYFGHAILSGSLSGHSYPLSDNRILSNMVSVYEGADGPRHWIQHLEHSCCLSEGKH